MFNFLMFLMDTSHRFHQLLFTSMVQRTPQHLSFHCFTFSAMPLSAQDFYRTSTHFHSHSPQGSLSPSCIIIYLLQNLLYNQNQAFLKNSFDTRFCILSCQDTSVRHLSASPTSLSNITSFCYRQLLILFTGLFPFQFSLKRSLL